MTLKTTQEVCKTFVPWRESKAYEKVASFRRQIEPAEAVLVVPPSALYRRPALSVHVLQGCTAQSVGRKVTIFYAHLFFANWIGEKFYTSFPQIPSKYFFTERLFASSAFDLPPLGRNARAALAPMWEEKAVCEDFKDYTYEDLEFLAQQVELWNQDMAELALHYQAKIIGCTSMFEQVNSSLAFLKAVKQKSPETITLMGGANCLGEMADGYAQLNTSVDYIFSGESETVFPNFVEAVANGDLPKKRVIRGSPCQNMDAVPCPDYDDFYAQLKVIIPEEHQNSNNWLPYESSRGCWWGAKDTCLFCGLNGDMLTHRAKSPDRVLEDLLKLTRSYPPNKVMVYDNIIPIPYFKTLLPKMKGKFEHHRIFYEVKANINIDRMQALKDASITYILPGIEALSSSLLKRMHKGIPAHQNIACLRYANSCRVSASWNLLYGFPGDEAEAYEETLALLPLVRHLNPPAQLGRLHLDRFSPYFLHPQEHGIQDMRPYRGYRDYLPEDAQFDKIAYHFECSYPSGILENPELFEQLEAEVATWRRAWVDESEVHTFNLSKIMQDEGELDPDRFPVLKVIRHTPYRYELIDSRGLEGTQPSQSISREQALMALAGRGLKDVYPNDDTVRWSLDNKTTVKLDNRYVPLATATPDLIAEFELELRQARTPSLHQSYSHQSYSHQS